MKNLKNEIIAFIKDYVKASNAKGVVVGMSGGKDSLVVAKLCTLAIGSEKVFGVIMPKGDMVDIDDAKESCELLGIDYEIADIKNAYDEIESLTMSVLKTNNLSSVTKLNISPRIRMNILYSVGGTLRYLVANTSNLSERMVGYSTKWGDAVGDFAPIANLTKTEVCELGLELGLLEHLVNKKPADGLTGSTDEEIMGFSYAELDSFIREGKISKNHEKIEKMHRASAHKRNPITSFNSNRKNHFEDKWAEEKHLKKVFFLCKNYSGRTQTSIQDLKFESFSSSAIVSSIALFELPHAGNTVSKRLSDSSR